MKIKVTGFRIAIRPDALDEYTEGGIAIVHAKHEQASVQTGIILGIGDQAWKAYDKDQHGRPCGEPWAKIGDRIVYSQYAARKFTHANLEDDIAFINDDDVIAVLVEEDD